MRGACALPAVAEREEEGREQDTGFFIFGEDMFASFGFMILSRSPLYRNSGPCLGVCGLDPTGW